MAPTRKTPAAKPLPKRESAPAKRVATRKAAVKKAGAPEAQRARGPRKPRRADDPPTPASPAAAGAAGALLEGYVGAQYLLPLLSGGEARGLPGVCVTRVAFQRAALGHPMDDVIVTGHDGQGRAATLEVQAKRTITFTAADPVFAAVVGFAARAAQKPEFDETRFELALAIARTSTRIDQHVQEVLKWAREYQDAGEFFRRLNQPGVASQPMRDFVEAFRGHLRSAVAAHHDAAVWRLLRRFQVLAFDLEQPGSVCALYARERCAALLAPQDAHRAGELWDSLQQLALQVDVAGGDLDGTALRQRLTSERGFRLAGDRQLYRVRQKLAESSEHALADIETEVHGVRLERSRYAAAALSALEQGRYLEIRGAGGVGKSGVLKNLALRVSVESRIVVLAPPRVPGGGWAALAAQLGCDVDVRELLTDLAGDGGGTLFIDGIDRLDDPGQQRTVADLIRAAADVPGFRVAVTTRTDFDVDARAWLPAEALRVLGEAPPVVIDDLDDEVPQLRGADPALAALLRSGHPAEKLVRNLYRLERLARTAPGDAEAPYSEAQMALQWWGSGDSADRVGRGDRRRVLLAMALQSLTGSEPLDTRGASADAVQQLIASGSLRERRLDRVEFAHDVLHDWAIGCLLYEGSEHVESLPLGAPAPMRLVRGLEMAARLHAEKGVNATAWRALLDRVSGPAAHGSWKRAVLLALVRSERAHDLLDRCLPELAAHNAALLGELVRAAIVIDSRPAAPLWQALGADVSKLPHDFIAPSGPAWANLIGWSLTCGNRLPHDAVPLFVELYRRWCNAGMGRDPLSPRLVERLYTWLCEVEAKRHPRVSGFSAWHAAPHAPGLPMTAGQESDLRTAFLAWCKLRPKLGEAYLRAVATHPYRHVLFQPLLAFTGSAELAAPEALADLFLDALPEGDDADDERGHGLPALPFSRWDHEYFPASPARKPFLDLLWANAEQGLRLMRGVVAHAVSRRSRGRDAGDDRVTIPCPEGQRSFPWRRSYLWSRAQDSHLVASALMALEAWAHLRIERGDPLQAVVTDVLGPEGSPSAILLVAVDVMLSHWPQSRDCLWPFAASADLLGLDRQRVGFDLVNARDLFGWGVRPEPLGLATLDSLRRRPSRRAPLDAVLCEFGYHGPPEVRSAMQQALREQAARLGPPDEGSDAWGDPRFAAMSALTQLDEANYRVSLTEDGKAMVEYIAPANEVQLLAQVQTKVARGTAEVLLRGQLALALGKPSCPVELLERGLAWATHEGREQTAADAGDREWIDRTRYIAAALLMRDGSAELQAVHGAWARQQLLAAASIEPDRGEPVKLLPYNPAAIAAVGLLASCRDGGPLEDLHLLLQLAARHDTGMAAVLRAEVAAARPVRAELVRSMVRLGLVAAIYAVRQNEDLDLGIGVDDIRARFEAREKACKEAEQTRRQRAVEAELARLTSAGAEPAWPQLPESRPPRARSQVRLGKPRTPPRRPRSAARAFVLESRAAAAWLSLAADLWGNMQPDLLASLVRHCWPWTAGANGVGAGADEEPGEQPYEWNDAYFMASLVAGVASGDAGIAQLVLGPMRQLPDERFFDAAEAVLHKLDALWLNDGRVSDETVLSIRRSLVARLVATQAWHYVVSERSSIHGDSLAGAIAAIFLWQPMIGQGPRCYVTPAEATRAAVLLPMLTELTEQAASSAFVALAFLGLLDVEPRASGLEFLARAQQAWWRAHGASAEFWVDHGVGPRACAWIDKAVVQGDAGMEVLAGPHLITMLDTLVRCGIPAATLLEERIAAKRVGGGIS